MPERGAGATGLRGGGSDRLAGGAPLDRGVAGDAAASLASREAALAIAVAHGNEVWEAMALHELGALHHLAERRDEAERTLARALALYRVHDVTIEAAEVEAYHVPRL